MSNFGISWNPTDPIHHDFLLDSGCTHHMVWNPHLFTKFIGNDENDIMGLGNVFVGHGFPLPIRGYGDIWPFGRVLYAPGITANILSCKMLCDHHGYSIFFINATATITDWCSMQNIMRATLSTEGMYKITYHPDITTLLDVRIVYNQLLPSLSNPAKCLMIKASTTISESPKILTDPVPPTNELILVDSGCSDHMFNTNVQLTNYTILNYQRRHVQVANGHKVPVLGSGRCGILSLVYYVPDLSHSLLSVR